MDAHDVARLTALLAIWLMMMLLVLFLSDGWEDMSLAHRDFYPLYSAGTRIWAGESPYLRSTQPFVHPPLAIPLVALFALAPLRPAFLAILAAGAVAFLGALAILVRACGATGRDRATAIVVSASAPSFYFALFLGQLSGLYLLCFVGCLGGLALGADVLAGVCAGLLLIKPPLALALVFAIVASRSRRAALATGITALVLVLLTLPWGIAVWRTWLGDAGWWASTLEAAPGTWWRQWTLYSFVRSSTAELGLSWGAARAISLAITVPLGGAAAWVAARALRRGPALRMRAAAVLALATVALNAYLFYYDALLLVVPAVVGWLLRATYAPRARIAVVVLVLVSWALQFATPLFGQGGVPLPGLVATIWLMVEVVDLAVALNGAPPARRE